MVVGMSDPCLATCPSPFSPSEVPYNSQLGHKSLKNPDTGKKSLNVNSHESRRETSANAYYLSNRYLTMMSDLRLVLASFQCNPDALAKEI